MIEIGREYFNDALSDELSGSHSLIPWDQLLSGEIKKRVPLIKIKLNNKIESIEYIQNYRINLKEKKIDFNMTPERYFSYNFKDLKSITFLDSYDRYKTDLKTDLAAISKIINAVIYNFDSGYIIYQNMQGRILKHYFCGIYPYMMHFELNNINLPSNIELQKIQVKIDGGSCLDFYTSSILGIKVYNQDHRQSRISEYMRMIKREKGINYSEDIVTDTLYKKHLTNTYDYIYTKNKFSPTPQRSLGQLSTEFQNDLNRYLKEDSLKNEMYRKLLHYLDEFEKYTLTIKEKSELQLLFIEKILALYDKFTEFDRFNYFKHELYKMNLRLYSAYGELGKDYIINCNYNFAKINSLQKKNKILKMEYERFKPIVLIDIYSTFVIKESLSVQLAEDKLREIFNKHSIYIKVKYSYLKDYYKIAFNKSKKTIVLLRRKY
uniref:hypothetical protein n=1 Tax=uncultured Dysgonomonas sp. TaxID=206096 RepID=UPI002590B1CA|nr:hypothetical protein [uncultured Dysgonomonas sp.]